MSLGRINQALTELRGLLEGQPDGIDVGDDMAAADHYPSTRAVPKIRPDKKRRLLRRVTVGHDNDEIGVSTVSETIDTERRDLERNLKITPGDPTLQRKLSALQARERGEHGVSGDVVLQLYRDAKSLIGGKDVGDYQGYETRLQMRSEEDINAATGHSAQSIGDYRVSLQLLLQLPGVQDREPTIISAIIVNSPGVSTRSAGYTWIINRPARDIKGNKEKSTGEGLRWRSGKAMLDELVKLAKYWEAYYVKRGAKQRRSE